MRLNRHSMLMVAGAGVLSILVSAPVLAGDWVRAGPQDQVKGCSMAAFVDPEFKGPSWKTHNSWAVVGWEFDSQISSIKIHAGIWQFYKGANFQDQIETLFPGNYAHLKPTVDNLIRSFRCVRAT
jgi:hypothetical protein